MLVTCHREPLHHNASVFKLPEAGELVEERGARKAKGIGGARAEKGFGLDVLQQLKGIRADGAILVKNKGDKLAALVSAVGAILACLRTGPGIQRLARLHVLVGGGVDVDTREIKQDGAVGHGDMAIWQHTRQILGDEKARALIVAGKT